MSCLYISIEYVFKVRLFAALYRKAMVMEENARGEIIVSHHYLQTTAHKSKLHRFQVAISHKQPRHEVNQL